MKNSLIIKLLFIGLIIFSSCSKDNDENTPDNSNEMKELLIGEWKYERYQRETNNVIVTDNMGTECQTTYTRQAFLANGDFTYISSGGTTLDNCNVGTLGEGTWAINGNIITTSYFEMDYTIVSLTASTLVYKFSVCDNDCNDWNIYHYSKIN